MLTELAPWRTLVPMQSVPVSPPPMTTTCQEEGREGWEGGVRCGGASRLAEHPCYCGGKTAAGRLAVHPGYSCTAAKSASLACSQPLLQEQPPLRRQPVACTLLPFLHPAHPSAHIASYKHRTFLPLAEM